MRHEKLEQLLLLARTLAGSAEGLTLDEMAAVASVSRSTAERMCTSLLLVFPTMEDIADGRKKRFRIPGGLDSFYNNPTVSELGALNQAAQQLERGGQGALARSLRDLERKLDIQAILSEVSERENHRLLCKKGIGSNILEFARHALGQRQAANPILRGYDQGYALRKKSVASSSPWVVGLGPVSVLALVHCSLADAAGPRSVRRLAQHLAAYGVTVDHREIASNDLGHQLRMLGLVLDSPDAESGMLLVPPFATQRHAGAMA